MVGDKFGRRLAQQRQFLWWVKNVAHFQSGSSPFWRRLWAYHKFIPSIINIIYKSLSSYASSHFYLSPPSHLLLNWYVPGCWRLWIWLRFQFSCSAGAIQLCQTWTWYHTCPKKTLWIISAFWWVQHCRSCCSSLFSYAFGWCWCSGYGSIWSIANAVTWWRKIASSPWRFSCEIWQKQIIRRAGLLLQRIGTSD